jgi:4-hydroxy-tetrahydrodipicolinate reductase
MSDLPGIVVTGASGRMGQMLVQTIAGQRQGAAGGCVERAGPPLDRPRRGRGLGGAALGVTVTDDALEAFAKAQAVIDFTAPAATVEFAALAAQARLVHVIGTTGLEPAHLAQDRGRRPPCGDRARRQHEPGRQPSGAADAEGAAALDEDWDIEIVEAHHRMKVDAPSGTALMLGQAAAEGRGVSAGELPRLGPRRHHRRARAGTIGFSASAAATSSANMT